MRSRIFLLFLVVVFGVLACAAAATAKTIDGDNGGRTHRGTAGVDVIHGWGGSDRLYGRGGDDQMYGDTGNDRLYGQDGNDLLDGFSGDEVLSGGAGDDTLDGGFGHDRLLGGSGDDKLEAGAAGDVLRGGSGNDSLAGGSGPDELSGGEGDDVLWANDEGRDPLADCGPGNDILYIDPYRMRGGISDKHMRKVGCEQVIERAPEPDPMKGIRWSSLPWADTGKHGTELNDTLLGGHGSDSLHGHGGDDVLWADRLPDSGGRRATLQRDHVDAGAGKDIVYAGRGTNTIDGGDGDDYIQTNGRRNTVRAGAGEDSVRVQSGAVTSVHAGSGNDKVTAFVMRGRVRVDCGSGRDTLQVSKHRVYSRLVSHRNCESIKRG